MRRERLLGCLCALLLMVAACGTSDEVGGPVGVGPDGEIDVPALAQFVEEARGREFRSEPTVTFVDQIGGGPGGGGVGAADWDVFRLTGVIPVDSDRDAANAVFDQGVGGFCCPVRVATTDDPVATASVAVHELVHLLDRDLIRRPSVPPPMIEFVHIAGIVEGNAARIQELFLETHGRDLAGVREQIEVPPEMPIGVVDLITASYIDGENLTAQIAAEGGEPAIDEAYGRNPASAEQVMFPAAYVDGDVPTEVEAPTLVPGESPVRSGTLGTFILSFMVPDDQRDVLSQWSGDAYSLWAVDDDVCLAAEVLMDSADAASLLAGAVSDSVLGMSAAAQGERVALERCLPSS